MVRQHSLMIFIPVRKKLNIGREQQDEPCCSQLFAVSLVASQWPRWVIALPDRDSGLSDELHCEEPFLWVNVHYRSLFQLSFPDTRINWSPELITDPHLVHIDHYCIHLS